MDTTKERHEPIIIMRKNGNMALMSLEDYNALEETAYILSNSKNAQRILSSLTELRSGRGKERKLIEPQS
ncbi:MAG: type II toxin-antitoxin system Phd/YefM family antitoxin [Alphaproteobacteria bacterium]|nr:type II toxin-antitoxin system Phd/YefM family antitoxin [Alphaproteobacteria bacterium]